MLSVGDYVDAARNLVPNNIRHRAMNALVVRLAIVGSLCSLAFMRSSRSLGRAKLPQWVVRMRSVLCFMIQTPPQK